MTKIMRTIRDIRDSLSRETRSTHTVLSNDYTSAPDDINNLVDDMNDRLSNEELPGSGAKNDKIKNGKK